MHDSVPNKDAIMEKVRDKVVAIALMEGLEPEEVVAKAIINYVHFWDIHNSTDTVLSIRNRKSGKLMCDVGRI